MKRILVAVCLAVAALAAFAVPTVEQVQAEVAKGNYAQAEVLMRDVVTARPNSARAHYVYAEILAHDRRFDMAAEQVARARQIDPALKFTQPDKFNAFAQLIEREQAAAKQRAVPANRAGTTRAPDTSSVAPSPGTAMRSEAAPAGGLPGWVWAGGLAVIALLAWRAFTSRRTAGLAQPTAVYPGSAAYAGQPGGPAPGYGPGGPGAVAGYGPGYQPVQPGYGPGYGPGRAGGGLLGTGMAVAGGVAAGMLAGKLFDGHRDPGSSAEPAGGAAAAGGLMPGPFDGLGDDAAARELEQRPIDMGLGDEWGGSADMGGGEPDLGSSGDDEGGW